MKIKYKLKIGDRFGILTIIDDKYISKNSAPSFLCQCDCGSEPLYCNSFRLRNGITVSCGCTLKYNFVKNGLKKCRTCLEIKTIDNYGKGDFYPDKIYPTCKECLKFIQTKRKYNLNKDDYYNLLKLQNYKCAICHRSDLELVVDHNHNELKVRGLLCHKCNLGIGLVHESINVLENSIVYLENHENLL